MENTQETVQNTSQTTEDNLQNTSQTTEDTTQNSSETKHQDNVNSVKSEQQTTYIQSNANSTLSFIKNIARPESMDKPNREGYDVLIAGIEKGDTSEFIEHVFTDQDTGRHLSYGEMRARYG